MLKFQEVSLQRGGRWLFRQASWEMYGGQKVGVVGANGSGKSSMLGLISGSLEPDEGNILLEGKPRLAYVEQHIDDLSLDVLSFVMAGDTEFVELESLVQNTNDPRWPGWQERFEQIGGYRRKADAQALLAGLGFSQDQMRSPVGNLSGGWQVRANLAKALLTPCDLLLLDEPTNHLDLPAIRWLESWLSHFSGGVLVVSHDGHFLDAFAHKILLVEGEKIQAYQGNYSRFLEIHAQRQQLLAAENKKLEQQQKKLERFIQRFSANASKSTQAQSRIKQLQKLAAVTPILVKRGLDFSFNAPEHLPSPMVVLEHADVGHDTPLLYNVHLQIQPGQKIGLIGLNGSGKTTLLSTLVGDLPPLTGNLRYAKGLQVAYFKQQTLADLPTDATALAWMSQQQPNWTTQQIRDHLGRFGFPGSRVDQTVSAMSGGEKTRLVLAALVAEPKHLLVLDEPTNHLDVEAREGLAAAVSAFDGAVLLVSHDRRFLESTVDEYWVLHDGHVRPSSAALDSLLESLKPVRTETPRANVRRNRQERAKQRERLAPIKKRLQAAEEMVSRLSHRLEELHRLLADEATLSDPERLTMLAKEHQELTESLSDAEDSWMQAISDWEEALGDN